MAILGEGGALVIVHSEPRGPGFEGARWCCGRASDSESRGPGFDPHKRHRVVSLSKTL